MNYGMLERSHVCLAWLSSSAGTELPELTSVFIYLLVGFIVSWAWLSNYVYVNMCALAPRISVTCVALDFCFFVPH